MNEHLNVDKSLDATSRQTELQTSREKVDEPPEQVYREHKATNDERSVSYLKLFRYCTIRERVLIGCSLFLATLAAFGVPYSVGIYGEYTSLLVDRARGVGASTQTYILSLFGGGKILVNATEDENAKAMRQDTVAFGLGCLAGSLTQWVIIALAVDILNAVALKQIKRIRKQFLESILRQDKSWHDTTTDNNFASKMSEDIEKLKDGIGEKVAMFTFLIASFFIVNVTSFLYGWQLTLVIFSCVPFIIVSTALVAKVQSTLAGQELKAYSVAGAVAEEVFSGIRTVQAFSGEDKEAGRYRRLLKPAETMGRKKGFYSGIGAGIMWFIIYFSYALAVWYGVGLILEDRDKEVREYTPAVLIIVLFGVIMGAQNLGFSSPHIEAFGVAKAVAVTIFSIIDRKSAIDPMSEEGLKPDRVGGNIEFEDVRFRYPSRSEVEVLKGLSLTIKAGQTVAFVGASGCGKSTCLQLFQRMYDPEHGCVRLDGRNIKELNVAWLRSQIGVVGQEPVLFATTIEENIRFGNPSVTQAEIERACKMTNCHSFITQLPEGYKTMVGEKGAQMSGGQKQRIAIARALVRNPKILLLDEATSALDPTSERRVQVALEAASEGRTTLVVAHRLSTITNADRIFFISDGVVVEEGTHQELMAKEGAYCALVSASKRHDDIQRDFQVDPRMETSLSCEEKSLSEGEERLESGEPLEGKSENAEKYNVSLGQLLKLNSPEWMYLVVGCVAAAMYGLTFTVWAICFGEFYGVMSAPDEDYVRSESNFYALLFVVIGLVSGIGTLTQMYMFNMAGVKLTSRLRQRAFKTIISQEVGYFDDQSNSVGALCSRLAGDCSSVQGATGTRIGIMVQAAATLLVGLVVSLMLSWKLTLVTLVPIPFMIGSNVVESRYMESSSRLEKQAEENASQVAVEAVANIGTINSLGLERSVVERYTKQTELASAASRRRVRFRGTVFGFAQASPLLSFGLSLFYGGLLVADGTLEYKTIIKISEALLFGAWMLAQATAYAPNLSAAVVSAGRLMKLFERDPALHSPAEQSCKRFDASGDISFEDIEFHYPTRREAPVLKGLNLQIPKGTTVALVGPSGCGKSTCVQLLLRHYDPVSGAVSISSTPTTEFPLSTLRSQLGLVSQEPVLFDRTIAENIAYGDNFRENIPMTEIIESAKKSNIHDFIVALPQGYDTSLGSKGAQLSGGQKQRIAIARALVRNPKILVLDEATSALDMQSEKVVQEALDAARAGRTCITIAQRLTTIRDADQICVLQRGVIAEQGKHDELMQRNGIYAGLYTMQLVP